MIVRHGVLEANAHFLQKPFAPDELLRKVRWVLDEDRSILQHSESLSEISSFHK
jgi:DNA-binding response OmpR family regulator